MGNACLERIANAIVMVMFLSFAALLMPSIASISDPVGTFLAPGTNPRGFASAVGSAVHLLLSSLMYQNIVPSIMKLLDFDRAKTTTAIAIGSLILGNLERVNYIIITYSTSSYPTNG